MEILLQQQACSAERNLYRMADAVDGSSQSKKFEHEDVENQNMKLWLRLWALIHLKPYEDSAAERCSSNIKEDCKGKKIWQSGGGLKGNRFF
ncbi:hypothetical protein R6Q59_029964 [Mikania micrantha]